MPKGLQRSKPVRVKSIATIQVLASQEKVAVIRLVLALRDGIYQELCAVNCHSVRYLRVPVYERSRSIHLQLYQSTLDFNKNSTSPATKYGGAPTRLGDQQCPSRSNSGVHYFQHTRSQMDSSEQ